MTAPLLEVRDLRIEYRSRRSAHVAVESASLELARGEALALVGESGSGKSSIGRAVLGLQRGSTRVTGTVRLDGEDLLGMPEGRRRALRGAAIALVPQDPMAALDPLRRVGDQVAEVLRVHRLAAGAAARERALAALAEAGLPDPALAQRYPHQLSGGQRQRVLIAAAIVAEPRLVVADEPTSALDVTVQRTILDRLQALTAERGTGLLLITHDLAVAAERADRIAVLDRGRIVEDGRARAVVAAPAHASTRALVGSLPQLRAEPLVAPAPDDAPVVLRGEGLSLAFGHGPAATVALDGVDLALRRGQSLGVVGESGSGKTTLARVVLGLARPDAGRVELDGAPEPERGRSRAFRRRVQPVFQDPYSSLDPSHVVGHAILEPVRALARTGRAERRARLAELLEQVRLPSTIASRLPGELSGGQLQRVAIARALSVGPDVLVCDEAVSALDVTVQAQVLELLAELQRERGLSTLFITHDLAVLRLVCDTVAVMEAGRIVEQGPTAAVLAAPAHPRTRALLEAVPGAVAGLGPGAGLEPAEAAAA
ncbi:dipeptide ABC transporter ATP-binding protein [Agrococcus terreus]|uniref:ABC transporter ATP-binding protein n=1 Tax=Agrococcus terreus TaxID=574649 RepID=A0ABQ2KF45_9MICO|nr:ABC transporter ATP-binding protein [Agrococcus terreus]GGN81620.1 ABC transporter ATP-binding protein [Agrococcus terreus]